MAVSAVPAREFLTGHACIYQANREFRQLCEATIDFSVWVFRRVFPTRSCSIARKQGQGRMR